MSPQYSARSFGIRINVPAEWKNTETHFLPHWRHVFSSDLAALGLSNKQSDCVILAQNEHERVTNTAVFDSRSLIVALHVLNDLSLGSICRKLSVRALRDEDYVTCQAQAP